jgi:hypothetical protein
MMDRLRSPVRALAVTTFLICALSLAGLGGSHARPSKASQSVQGNGLPCNAACKSYMRWSHRVAAMFHPSRPLKRIAAHHGKPPRMMVHHAPRTRMAHHAPKPRQSGLNSFAQLSSPSDATRDPAETRRAAETPQATETPRAVQTPQGAEMPRAVEAQQAAEALQAEVAPSRPIDRIADRFPTAAEFMTAGRADSATHDAPDGTVAALESTVAALADPAPAAQAGTVDDDTADGPDLQLVVSLLLMLGSLPAFVVWWWFRARRDADRERRVRFDRTIARARRMPIAAPTGLSPEASLATAHSVR